MAKPNLFLAAVIAGMLAGVLPLGAQQNELRCFIMDPDVEGMTNIRATPGGKVIAQVEPNEYYELTAIYQPGSSWWKIKDAMVEDYGQEIKFPSKEAWIHRSVLALGTDNGDGHYRILRTEPRADAPKAGTVREFNAVLRPLEMSTDGKWVKVKYEEGKLTGWIEVSWTRADAFEPGDGYDFPNLNVYAIPDKDVSLLPAPGSGKKTYVMKKGKAYELLVAKPKDGWWEVLQESITCDGDYIDLPESSWVPSSDICMRIADQENKLDSVPVYSQAKEQSKQAGSLKIGTEVHPLDVKGQWPIWVKVVAADGSGLTGWINYSYLSWELPSR